ncbi:hypothetical protein Zmor_000319 [Zophobas morio]|uniref:Uncharacterized protein n=1 Tax=Zophobas morio TaxID=2755281 RepID=A0AA38MQI3_9CUCU|nr:hypothetical protein Zmor_000319 [Zophobas morio]
MSPSTPDLPEPSPQDTLSHSPRPSIAFIFSLAHPSTNNTTILTPSPAPERSNHSKKSAPLNLFLFDRSGRCTRTFDSGLNRRRRPSEPTAFPTAVR